MDTPTAIIAMLNQKGGVGKTTLTHHLTGAFSNQGKKVLLVDWDPQANLTQGWFGPQATEQLHPSQTAACLFDESLPEPDPDKLLVDLPVEGVKLLPGSAFLEDYDETRPTERPVEMQIALRDFLSDIRQDFDVILIDCRPTLTMLGWNALLAANRMMVPFQPEDYGSQGVVRVQQIFDRAMAERNPDLRLLGYVLTMVDKRLAMHRAYAMSLRQLYGDQVFDIAVPSRGAYKEAITARQNIHQYAKRSDARKAMDGLALEILARHETLCGVTPRFLYAGNHTQTNTTVNTVLKAG